MLLALLWIALVFLLSGPSWAQDAGTEGIPVGTTATGVDTGSTNDPPDLVRIAASDCTVARGASVTLEDGDGTRAEFVDDERGATITAPGRRPQIRATNGGFIGESATFPSTDTSFDTDGDYMVASFEGVTCTGTGDGQRVDEEEADPADDGAKTTNDLRNLSCDELLVLFRGESSSGQQYEDAAVFADSEVRARVEVCLENEIVKGTAADGDLPDTGGLSLIGLAVLGVA
ncbi:MAG: hypothetical protein AVDCRST_MAG03-3833, partial [uncultured Rubrobacteraceae bacterium]